MLSANFHSLHDKVLELLQWPDVFSLTITRRCVILTIFALASVQLWNGGVDQLMNNVS